MAYFTRNTIGRDFIVGDIHGAFQKLWNQLTEDRSDGSFDINRDRLFCVGDLVDRGPESEEAIQWLGQPWFHSCRGNHEVMCAMYAEGTLPEYMYVQNGGLWATKLPESELAAIALALVEKTHLFIELETPAGLIGLVHAECPSETWAYMKHWSAHGSSMAERMLWSRERIEEGIRDVVPDIGLVICGHTPVPEPKQLGNHLFIETQGWKPNKRFTIINTNDLKSA